ncbi:FGGY family carbohydrate kinase, partial [Streptomyces sp. NPDC058953]|uniref:FGGY family carbohydrate kinase n=1 Tax=Streptomyces sp. NPDC058953 TaxID=3346676 RepID=UPI0036CF77D1
MGIVAGLDSSSAFSRVVVCDEDTGTVVRQGYAQHPVDPKATDVDPQAWLLSLGEAAAGGLLEGVQAIGVSAQQNGLVALDQQGAPVRPALVGNDRRAQVAAAELIDALGGRQVWARPSTRWASAPDRTPWNGSSGPWRCGWRGGGR